MRPYVPFIILLLLFTAFAEDIEVDITTISDLVTVNSSIDFTKLIPGYDYGGQLSVNWAIPEKSIERIQAKEIPVYVLLSTSENNTIYFIYEGKSYKRLSLTLLCTVSNSTCSDGSVLTRTVEVRAKPLKGTTAKEMISVNASLTPFEEPSILSQISSAIEGFIGQVSGSKENQSKEGMGENATQLGVDEKQAAGGVEEKNGTEGAAQEKTLPAIMNENLPLLAVPLLVAAVILLGYIISRIATRA